MNDINARVALATKVSYTTQGIQERTLFMTTLRTIEKLANDFNNDALEIARELKKVQSAKCRLKKQKRTSSFEREMKDLLTYEEALKEARQLLNPKAKPVTMYTQADVDKLDYDETVKALKSIQSKKTLSRWLTDVEGDNDEFRKACEIEAMLKAKRDSSKPVEEAYIRKSDLQTVIDTIESSGKLSQEKIVELLKDLI